MCAVCPATNLTAGTVYEVAVWAHTSIGDSPTALSHHQTAGPQPDKPLLKAKALNQTAVDCSWSVGGPPDQVHQADNFGYYVNSVMQRLDYYKTKYKEQLLCLKG